MNSHSDLDQYPSSFDPSTSPPNKSEQPDRRTQTLSRSPSNSPRRASSPSAQKRPPADIIKDTFPPFDSNAVVVEPFHDEMRRDAEFHEKLKEMLLECFLEAHAWASARPKHDTQSAADRLKEQVQSVMDVEKEQGRSSGPSPHTPFAERIRTKLRDYIFCIQNALAALTATPL